MLNILRFLAKLDGRVLVALVVCACLTTLALSYIFSQNAQAFISLVSLILNAILLLKKGSSGKVE